MSSLRCLRRRCRQSLRKLEQEFPGLVNRTWWVILKAEPHKWEYVPVESAARLTMRSWTRADQSMRATYQYKLCTYVLRDMFHYRERLLEEVNEHRTGGGAT